jgi:hypothetical protein
MNSAPGRRSERSAFLLVWQRLLLTAFVVAVALETGSASAAPPRIPPNAAVKTYLVQPGDSAWSIAEEFYGRGDYYPIIYEFNGFEGKGPFLLTPGQTLRLPIVELGPEARVAWLQRDVRAKPPRSVDWLKAREEMNLWRMYRVATGDASAATIVFEDDSDLRMREKALLVIYGATATAARVGASGERRIDVEEGTVVAGLAALEGTGEKAPLDVRTPSGTVGVLGLAIQVQVEAAVSAVSAMIGEATVSAENTTVKVPESFGTVVEKGRRPEPPVPLPAAPDWMQAGAGEAVVPVWPGSASTVGRFEAEWLPVPDADAYRVEVAAEPSFKSIVYDVIVDGAVTGLRLEALDVGTWHVRVASRTARGLEGRAGAPIQVSVVPVRSLRATRADDDGTLRVAGFTRLSVDGDAAHLVSDDGTPSNSLDLITPGQHLVSVVSASGKARSTPITFEVEAPGVDVVARPDAWPLGETADLRFRITDPRGAVLPLPGVAAREADGTALPLTRAEDGAWVVALPPRAATAPVELHIAWAGGHLAAMTLAPNTRMAPVAELRPDRVPLPGSLRRGGHTPLRRAVGASAIGLEASATTLDTPAVNGVLELTVSGDYHIPGTRAALDAAIVGQEVALGGLTPEVGPSARVGDLWLGGRAEVDLADSLLLIPSGHALVGLGRSLGPRHLGLSAGATLRWDATDTLRLDLAQQLFGSAAPSGDGHELRATTTLATSWQPAKWVELQLSWQLIASILGAGDRASREGELMHTFGLGVAFEAAPWLNVGATLGLGVPGRTEAELGGLSGRLLLEFPLGAAAP